MVLGSQFKLGYFYIPFFFFFFLGITVAVSLDSGKEKDDINNSISILSLDMVIIISFYKTFTISIYFICIILLNLCNNSLRYELLLLPI